MLHIFQYLETNMIKISHKWWVAEHACQQAISSLERKLKQHASNDTASGQDEKQVPSVPVDPQIYCILGHLNLLLENYPKGITKYTR